MSILLIRSSKIGKLENLGKLEDVHCFTRPRLRSASRLSSRMDIIRSLAPVVDN